jgi:hypothetical protein
MILETIIEEGDFEIFKLKDQIQRDMIKSGFLTEELFWIIGELYKLMSVVDFTLTEKSFVFSYDIQGVVNDLLKSYCAFVTILSVNG